MNMANDKGAILIAAIIMLLFISILGFSLITYLYARTQKANLELDRLKALYLAEAAIAKSIYELRLNLDYDNNGIGNILKTHLGKGTYKASHNFQSSYITGIGEFNKIKRIIQIKYSAL